MTVKPPTSIADYQTGSPFGNNDLPPFKEGQTSTHALGVLYQAPWERPADGFNEHARRCARALAMTGCPVHLRGVGRGINAGLMAGPEEQRVRDFMAPLLDASISKYSVQIQQLILTASLAQTLGTHRFLSEAEFAVINQYRVLYSVWERDRVSPQIATILNRMGQIWVACYRNVDMLERCGVNRSKIKVVPVPYFDDDPLLKLRGRKRRSGVPRFYHIGKWEPRKAQDKILEAFMRAFRPSEATFTMKTSTWATSAGEYPRDPETVIASALQIPGVIDRGWTEANWKNSIEIISKRITDEQMVGLHGFGDVYVTLSRGEGFDMPAFDSKLAGNLMVYTPSGGPSDFAGAEDFLVPECGSVPCHSFYGWEEDAQYLDFEIVRAAVAMQYAADAVRQGARVDKPVFDKAGHLKLNTHRSSEPVPVSYRAEIVGENMLRNLYEVVGKEEKVF